jgi:Cu-Zn family superoxide dismutase
MNTTTKRWAARLSVVAVIGVAALGHLSGSASGDGWSAKAVLRDASGAKVGTVRFDGDAEGTTVKVDLRGVAPVDTFHGLHLHANDPVAACDAASGFANVGGHWNPTGGVHGQHAGDLPSVLNQADGTGHARSVTGRFEPSAIEDRAVILHLGADNFANVPAARYQSNQSTTPGPDSVTLGNGDAGGRIACGVIVLE